MMSRIKSRPAGAAVSFVITLPGVVTPPYVAHPGTPAKTGSAAQGVLGARSAEMPVKEVKDLVPAVDRLLGPVIRPVPREEGVAGAVVAVELIVLPGALQSLFGLVDVL